MLGMALLVFVVAVKGADVEHIDLGMGLDVVVALPQWLRPRPPGHAVVC